MGHGDLMSERMGRYQHAYLGGAGSNLTRLKRRAPEEKPRGMLRMTLEKQTEGVRRDSNTSAAPWFRRQNRRDAVREKKA